ncbi:MAG: AI-2E family transporter, partial [Novosphingobium sp.]
MTDLHPTMATTPEIISPTEHDGFVDRRARLQSAIVLVLGLGLFLALPFVLSIGSVVFLPPVTAIIFTIVLSPLADRLTRFGLPNTLASFIAILALIAVVLVALLLILQPAFVMVDQV